jgi:hypothetical protein
VDYGDNAWISMYLLMLYFPKFHQIGERLQNKAFLKQQHILQNGRGNLFL